MTVLRFAAARALSCMKAMSSMRDDVINGERVTYGD
jgi:hypothetical protein